MLDEAVALASGPGAIPASVLLDWLRNERLDEAAPAFHDALEEGTVRALLRKASGFTAKDPVRVALALHAHALRVSRPSCVTAVTCLAEAERVLQLRHALERRSRVPTSRRKDPLLVVVGVGQALRRQVQERGSTPRALARCLQLVGDLAGRTPGRTGRPAGHGLRVVLDLSGWSWELVGEGDFASRLLEHLPDSIRRPRAVDGVSPRKGRLRPISPNAPGSPGPHALPPHVADTSFRWSEGGVSLEVRLGDLFEAHAEAIVNSEQADFELATHGDSISARLLREGGPAVQDELSAQARGGSLPVGTVLETSGGRLSLAGTRRLRRVFHAGVHEPHVAVAEKVNQQGDLEAVAACVREVLGRAARSRFRSVAFPLLGTGGYGLDPGIVAATMTQEVVKFGRHADGATRLEVQFILEPGTRGWSAMRSATQALLDSGASPVPWRSIALGLPLLDPLEAAVARCRDEHWRGMMVCRYAEVYSHYLLALVASGHPDRLRGRLEAAERPLSFGSVCQLLAEASGSALGATGDAGADEWRRFAVKRSRDSQQGLQRLVEARNDLAHGRPGKLRLADLESELRRSVATECWRNLGAPPSLGLEPWLVSYEAATGGPGATPRLAIVERFLKHATGRGGLVRYLDPVTSTVFERSP